MFKTLFVAATLALTGSAYADEVIIHRDDAPPATTTTSTTVEHHESADGCSSKTVHKENDAGDSKTVTKSDC